MIEEEAEEHKGRCERRKKMRNRGWKIDIWDNRWVTEIRMVRRTVERSLDWGSCVCEEED